MALKFQLVLPCYNESLSIATILDRVIARARSHGHTSESFQLIFVENGSRDNSRAIISEYLKNENYNSWVKLVPIDKNEGYGNGIWKGLQASTAPFVGWSHADQQTDPDDAFRALQILESLTLEEQKKTIVKGVREGRSGKEIFTSRTFEFLAWVFLGYRFYEINAQPKVFHRALLERCSNPPKDFAFDIYVLFRALKAGYSLKTFLVQFPPRVHGFSNWAKGLKNRTHHIQSMIQYMRALGLKEGRISSPKNGEQLSYETSKNLQDKRST